MGDPDENGGRQVKLSDAPEWHYLLREFYQHYRFGSAGGSRRIRSHLKEVRHRLSRLLERNPEVRDGGLREKPVCAHLPRALDRGRDQPTASIVRAVAHVCHRLGWEYGYDRLPEGLSRKYAFAELAGPRGPVVAHEVILGLVLFAPRTTYPAHSHQGITESYLCLSGAVSENEAGVYAPGSLILNPPEHTHRITTGDHEPSLLAYAWTGERQALAEQKLVFTRTRRDAAG